ncbi:MAG: DEAD/DEAH box helicase, partial [Clostridia bacterium]|nr:DEAD/DEAH box helicase [Clostridia bacterium]
AYVISILNRIENDGVGALVVAPTKELAIQIKEVFDKFVKFLNLKTCLVVGGSDFTRQRFNLKTANIVIGTTGRIVDHLNRRTLKLHKLKFLVLDEADVMLDMGFIEDIKLIYKACPKHKNTYMLSATFNDKVKELAVNFLNKPEIIEINKDNKIVDTINQCFILCLKKGKFETLLNFIKTLYKEKTIIFVNTKSMAEELYKKLKSNNINTEFINGDLEFKERKKVINNFKSYNNDILIATDVASRGLDINNVEFVINYDLPIQPEIYIHRIGRTARAGKSGVSLSLVNSEKQLKFLIDNFSNYNLTEIKVKKDEKTNKTIFVETKSFNFNFEEKPTKIQKNKKDLKNTLKNSKTTKIAKDKTKKDIKNNKKTFKNTHKKEIKNKNTKNDFKKNNFKFKTSKRNANKNR